MVQSNEVSLESDDLVADMEFLDDLAQEIASWGNFFIISNWESIGPANEFREMLEKLDISSFVIDEMGEMDFVTALFEGDAALAISETGNEDYILNMVKTASANDVKVYAFCGDSKSPLALFCESIIINGDDDFNENALMVFNHVCGKLSDDFNDDVYRVQESVPSYVAPKRPSENSFLSSVYGIVLKVNIGIGSKVKEGDVLCVVEAMKMEIDVLSDREGIVEELFIYPGCSIAEGDIMMEIVDEDSTSIVGEGKTQPWIMDDGVNGNIVSSFCGMVVRVAVEVGDEVRKGDVVCVVEVMKLQSDILANRDGIVEEIMVGPGDFVQEDEILMVIK